MLLTAAFLFGVNGSAIKTVMHTGITGAEITLYRSLSSTLIAGLVLFATNRGAFAVQRSEWKWLLLLGIAGVGLMQFSYANAVANLPVGVALLMQYTAIIIVPIVSIWLFKKRLGLRVWLAVGLVLSGLVVVSRIWLGGLNSVGLFFGATAAIATTVYYLVGEHVHKRRDPVSTLFFTMGISSCLWFTITPWWKFDVGRFANAIDLGGNLTGIMAPGWVMFLWLGLMGAFLPLFLTYAALRHLSATSVGLLSTTETIFGFLFAYLWLGEKIDEIQTIGGLLVIAGIVLAQSSRRSSKWQLSN